MPSETQGLANRTTKLSQVGTQTLAENRHQRNQPPGPLALLTEKADYKIPEKPNLGFLASDLWLPNVPGDRSGATPGTGLSLGGAEPPSAAWPGPFLSLPPSQTPSKEEVTQLRKAAGQESPGIHRPHTPLGPTSGLQREAHFTLSTP